MTLRERAEQIAIAHYNKVEGNPAQDKAELIAAIEQGMNEVIESVNLELSDLELLYSTYKNRSDVENGRIIGLQDALMAIRAMKSSNTPRNTITDNQKDEN